MTTTVEPIHSYKDLIVWQKSMDLLVAVYGFTDGFPETERYGLSSQMRRATVSISSNIAEGRRRGSRKDYRQFLIIAYGSGAELETQLEASRRLSFGRDENRTRCDALLNEVMRMLNKMLSNMSA
ncbi:four helix bundle protein [Candidatus Uhrbacteria bacterium]|nr:four helix bundle protein [Candidatus Uhrbacteria bacterium]